GDVSTLTTTVTGEQARTVELVQTAQGAVIELDPQATIDFGNVPIGSTGSNDLKVVNSGNAPAKVTLSEATTGSANASYTLDGQHMVTLTFMGTGATTLKAVYAPGAMAGDAIASESLVSVAADPATVLC